MAEEKQTREERRAEREAEERDDLAAEYGWSLKFLNSNKELKRLFNQAVEGSWSPQRFVAELRDTKWFQNTASTTRQFLVNQQTDPASWQQDVDRMTAHVRDTYGQIFGVPLTKKQASRWAKQSMMFGWTDEQIKDQIVGGSDIRKLYQRKALGGTAGQVKDQIRQLAGRYGVSVGDKWQMNQLENILSGDNTIDGVAGYMKELAKSKYTAFADQLDAGKTMEDIADPYVQSMSQLLELNPQNLGLKDATIQKALTRRLEGKPDPMSLSQFEDFVRKDKRWMYTDQANEQFSTAAHDLAQQWGLL
jgi:hypothetical protein